MKKANQTMNMRTIALCALALLVASTSAVGLPRGYKEDFNGCARNTVVETRSQCCRQTYDDCIDKCSDEDNANAQIECYGDCGWALGDCAEGKAIKRVDWPGSSVQVPELIEDSGGLGTENDAHFEPGQKSVLIELHGANPERGFECLGMVVTCESPTGKACIPQASHSRIECHSADAKGNTKSGADSQCRPVLMSVQSCGLPQRGVGPSAK